MANFSRRHYIVIAKAIAQVRDMAAKGYDEGEPYNQGEIIEAITLTMADALQADNSRFDRERFLQASRGDHA